MRALILIAMTLASATVSAAAPTRDVAARGSFSCRIVTGYGTAIGKGSSKLQAKENAREICGSKMIDDYFARRGNIDPDVVDDLALACVNLECQ